MNKDTTIDELKEQINLLKSEREQHLSLFDKGEVSLFKWNNDEGWTTAYASKNVYTLFGYTAKEFLNKDIDYADIIHKDDFQTVYDEVIHALDHKLDYFTHTTYRIVTKDKTIKWVLDNTYMIKDESGEVSHFLGTISDITDLKNYESNLEEMVQKKSDENLRQKDILYRQSRLTTIGETIQNISHQWRQPLNQVASNIAKLEMLNEKKFRNDDIASIISSVNGSLEYMSTTISDFNNFFAPQKEKTFFSIKDVIYDAIHIIRPSLNSANISLQLKLEESITAIEGHENELIQALLILLNNAKDALLVKKAKVDFNANITLSLYKKGSKIRLSVEDNADGIDLKIIDKIFEPYFTTKFKNQGTGIGLYMCKMLIEKEMDAKIDVKNTYNGALFTIIFNI